MNYLITKELMIIGIFYLRKEYNFFDNPIEHYATFEEIKDKNFSSEDKIAFLGRCDIENVTQYIDRNNIKIAVELGDIASLFHFLGESNVILEMDEIECQIEEYLDNIETRDN